MRRNKTHMNVIEVPSGKELKKLQKTFGVSVMAIARMTHLSRTSIYRAFNDVDASDSTHLLIYLALTNPDMFLTSEEE